MGQLANGPQVRGAATTDGIGCRLERCDRAMLAILLGCGLRRSEVAALTLKHIQQRDNRFAETQTMMALA